LKPQVAAEAFATVISLLPDATLLVASSGRIQAANARAGQMLEATPAQLSGRNLAEFVQQEPEQLEAFLRAAARCSAPVPGGMTLTDSRGRRVRCRLEGAVLTPRTADAAAVLLVRLVPQEAAVNRFVALNLRIDELGKEIGRRQRAEVALREQRELLLVTLSSIGDAVIATDAQGKVTFMNRIAELQTGWNHSEAAGRPLDEIFVIANETTRAPVESPVAKVLREGSVVGLANHTVLIAKDGTVRPIDDSGAPIRDANSKVLGVVLVFRDVTDRRALDRERAESDRRKDEFLAMLAHELRNPLAVLGNGIQYIQNAQKKGAVSDSALPQLGEAMHRQLRQLARLVDDLLDVSRLTTGKIVLRKAPISLDKVIQEALETCRPAIAARDIKLSVTRPAENLVVEADPARLSQVFCNLISNAVKFSEPGGVIRVGSEADGDGGAVVRVSDEGAGIPPESLCSVFDLFMQADTSLARSHGGLGVGLTVAKRITELHGGSIEAHSEGPGRGSEFSVRLPLFQRDMPVKPQGHMSGSSIPRGRGHKILVVDDNQDAALSLALLLRASGHDAETANDGETALRLSSALQPEVVLLDLGMPGMDGYEVARRLRQLPEMQSTVIIAVSGYGAEADRKRSSAAGFNHHLTKPIELRALDKVISEALGL
jgi:PAS domain S-box-containing protein